MNKSLGENHVRQLFALALTVLLAVATVIGLASPLISAPTPQAQAASVAGTNIYRLYNPNTGEHFYTSNLVEMTQLVAHGWYYEGIGWISGPSTTPVYRLFNPRAEGGDHYYTISKPERDNLVQQGWHYDGIFFNSSGNVPVQVAYNSHAKSGAHNFTANTKEQQNLLSQGWKYGQTAWYALAPTATVRQQLNAAVEAGKALLNYSSSRVTDNTVRESLTKSIQQAQTQTSPAVLTVLMNSMQAVNKSMRSYAAATAASKKVDSRCFISGIAICNSKADHTLYYVVNGTVKFTTPISFAGYINGVNYNTPNGQFAVMTKEQMSWSNPYKVWMYYSMYFAAGGFAMHYDPDVPSHGCIHINSLAAAQWLFNHTPVGTKVVVY